MKSIVKIWIIIIILAITFWGLIQWGADTYQKSSDSIHSITLSDDDAHITYEIFQSVTLFDLHIYNFIITKDEKQKNIAENFEQATDSLINVLRMMLKDDEVKSLQVDSLQSIISEKRKIHKILTDVKNRQTSQFFTEQALNKIKNQLSDSAFIEITTQQKENIVAKIDTIEQTEIIKIPDDFKGFKGFFRKLLGREKLAYDTLLTQETIEDYSVQLTENNFISKNYFLDSTIVAVKDILVEILNEEIALQKNLHQTELSIIKYNEKLIESIRILLKEISTSKEISILEQQKKALQQIQEANKNAFLIAGIGLILGLILLIFLIKDITKANIFRKKLEEEKARAEALAVAKESFLSSMSHEIKTPIHSIAGFVNLLDQEPLNAEQQEYLKGIYHAQFFLSQLINNILIQAKINADAYQNDQHEVYIPELSDTLKTLFAHEKASKKLHFDIQYSNELEKYNIGIDSIKLQQVLINLISNAFKFTQEGSIKVFFNIVDNELHIIVKDTGIGVASDQIQKIFLPFQQANPSNTLTNGTGLGLSITKHIIESFGGEIQVDSIVNEGTNFHIKIPVKTSPYISNQNINKYHTDALEVFFPIQILAIEDDEWNRFLLKKNLEHHAQTLTILENAEDGIEYFKANKDNIDLVLTDINLPKMNGKDFFSHIQKIKTVPTIAFSAGMSPNDKEELNTLGFRSSINKPFSKKDILDEISKIFSASISTNKTENVSDENELWIQEFKKSLSHKIQQLEQAFTQKNLSEIGRISHQLKSNFEQIQIFHFSEELQTLELCAEIQQFNKALEILEKLLPILKIAIQEIQNSTSN